MPLTYDQLSAITEKKFIPKMVDNIFDSNILLKKLRESSMTKVDGGERIMQPLNYAQATASDWYSGADTLDISDNDSITAAEYVWKQLYASIAITGADEKKNSGDAAKVSLLKSKVQIAEMTIKDKLGDGIYSDGSNAKSIVGLRDIVATDQTVGGISQTTYSWWQGKVDSSTTTLSIAAMQSLFNNASVDNEHPTMITATRSIYNSYYALLQPQQRFQDSKEASGGFANLLFNGVPFFTDSKCPSQHLFMVNMKFLHLYVHSQRDMEFEKFAKPVGQDVQIAKIYWMGAFGSSNNRMHGKMSAITA